MKTSGKEKALLVVLDFDGFLVNSYSLLQMTFEQFGLDIGDEERFRHRRKFLKYFGGGKELLNNLVSYSMPKKKKVRRVLTETYMENGRVYKEFVDLINHMISDPTIHLGIISRNFTHNPGVTIRTVLKNSDIDEHALDFVIPIPVGAKKQDVLESMQSSRYEKSVFGADEIGDYKAAFETGYDAIIMSSYGFDNKQRLIDIGEIPADTVFDTPIELAQQLTRAISKSNLRIV